MAKQLRTIQITATYLDGKLQKITGKESEIIRMPEGSCSDEFLHLLQERYPKIFQKFGPGFFGFDLNGKKPNSLTKLNDGDHYRFTVWSKSEVLADEQFKQRKEKYQN